jgi:hypothetical protein
MVITRRRSTGVAIRTRSQAIRLTVFLVALARFSTVVSPL